MSKSKKMNTIVWPVDPFLQSDKSTLSVAKVIRGITKKSKAKILPVYVLSPENFNIYPSFWSDWEVEHRALAEKKLRSLLKKTKLKNMLPPKVIMEPSLFLRAMVDRVLDYAAANSANLIITATHGRSGIKRFFLGSFAETLTVRSNVPVLAVNPSFESSGSFDKVFFPTDLRKKAEKSFLKVVSFTKSIQAELVIYFYLSTLSSPEEIEKPDSYSKYEKARRKKCETRINRLASKARTMGVKTTVMIDSKTMGMYDDLIVARSQKSPSQIIAMIPERGEVEAALFGSVTRTVLRNAHRPVWVLRR